MTNFLEQEAVKQEIAKQAKLAKSMNIDITRLENSSNASFRFEDGDMLTIPSQVAKTVSLTGDILATAKKNNRATGYFAFSATVLRDGKSIDVTVSLRQLYTNTVWTEAEPLNVEGIDIPDNVELFCAPLREGKKRFGECGTIQTVDGVPYIANEIKVEMHTSDAFVPYFLDETSRTAALEDKQGYTALVKRENYGLAL